MAKIGYARVSTRDQNPDAQVDALREAACERIFIDGAVRAGPDGAVSSGRSGSAVVAGAGSCWVVLI